MGRILSQHGLDGWLKIAPFAGDVLEVCERWLENRWDLTFRLTHFDNDSVEVCLRDVRPKSLPPLFAFEGIWQREQAKCYNGGRIWLRRSELRSCAENEFFYADLEKCVLTWKGVPIAPVRAVVEIGPSVLLEVERNGKRHLVPFVGHFIGDVDVGTGQIELKHDWILK